MSKSTIYYAAEDMRIQSVPIEKGRVVGSGNLEDREWQAAEGLENTIELGHALARYEDGRFTTENPNPEKKAAKPAASASAASSTASARTEGGTGGRKSSGG